MDDNIITINTSIFDDSTTYVSKFKINTNDLIGEIIRDLIRNQDIDVDKINNIILIINNKEYVFGQLDFELNSKLPDNILNLLNNNINNYIYIIMNNSDYFSIFYYIYLDYLNSNPDEFDRIIDAAYEDLIELNDIKVKLSLDNFEKLKSISLNDCKYTIKCYICFDDFDELSQIISLPCNEYFHKDCIKQWLLNESNKCPVCRIDLNESLSSSSSAFSDIPADSNADSEADSIADPIAETIADSFADPIAETIADSFADPIAETIADSFAESEADRIANSIADCIADCIAKALRIADALSIAESEADRIADSIAEAYI